MGAEPAARRYRRGAAALVLWAVPALLWAAALPLSSGADEPAHIMRAASIAGGQLLGEPTSDDPGDPLLVVDVPAAVAALPEPGCHAFHPEIPASCDAGRLHFVTPLGGGRYAAESASGRHPPAYYALVGLPYLLDLGIATNHLARILSAVVCAALLAAATAIALRADRPRLPVVGVLAAVPPMALYLTGLVNPNALEATAAVCLWTALLALARWNGEGRLPRGLLAAIGVSGIAMTLTRPASPLWLALAVATAVLVARPAVLRAALRDPAAWAWAVAGGVAAATPVAWMLAVGNPIRGGAFPLPPPLPLPSALGLSLGLTAQKLGQMIGRFGWLDTPLPAVAVQLWLGVDAVLVAAALVARRWWRATVLLALLVGSVLVPALLEALRYNDLGLIWQGRYLLPLAAGVPIVAGFLAAEASPRVLRVTERLALPLTILLAGLHVFSFALVLRRYVTGVQGPILFLGQPGWQPPLPAALLLAAFALSQLALVGWLAWRWRQAPALGELPPPAADSSAVRAQAAALR